MAVCVWGGLAVGVAVHGFFFPRAHTVYGVYAASSERWWAGAELYAPFVKTWTENGKTSSTQEYYRYCPLFAILYTPFSLAPYALGNALWKAFNIAFLGIALAYASRKLFRPPLTPMQTGAFLLLAAPLSLHSIYNGQANLIVVGATLFGLSQAACRRWNTAAAWVALATLIKGYPLAAGLLVSAIYPGAFALRYAGALALGLALPALSRPPAYVLEQTLAWCRHMDASTTLMRERQRSIDNLLALWGYPITSHTFAVAGVIAGMCVLGLCVLYVWRVTDPGSRITCVLMLYSAWVALFGQATESCTYVVMAPAIAWLLVESFHRPAPRIVGVALIASLMMMGPVVTDMFGPAVRHFAITHGSQPLGAILFSACLLRQLVWEWTEHSSPGLRRIAITALSWPPRFESQKRELRPQGVAR
jgi:hypothetical protein